MEMTNTRESPHGFNYKFFDKVIARYALDPLFKDIINLAKLVFKDVIWWCQDVIVVPVVDSFHKNIYFECHDISNSRLMHITKTLKQVETNFWWPRLKDDVKTCVNTCDVCQHSKTSITEMA